MPEVQRTSFYLLGIQMTPFTVCNHYGDKLVVEEVRSDERAEEITRVIAVVGDGKVGVTSHPLKGSMLKRSLAKGTVSLTWRVGKAKGEAKEKGKNVVEAIVNVLGAKVLFEGVAASDAQWEDRGGFTYGEMFFNDVKFFEGRRFKIWFKNENLVAWFDEEVCITCPDLIIVLRADDGSPVLNPHLKKGEHVVVISMATNELWRSNKAIEIFGPRHFGFDFDCVLLERSATK